MKRLLLIACLSLSGCWLPHKTSIPVVPDNRQSTIIGIQAEKSRSDVTDELAGDMSGSKKALESAAPSREKEVALMFLDQGLQLSGQPLPATKDKFDALANKLLSTDGVVRGKGETEFNSISSENSQLKSKLLETEANYKAALKLEHDKAESEKAAAVELEHLKAEEKDRKLISWIFFGGAFICICLAAVVFTTASYVPMFGPKVAFAFLGISGISTATGVSVLQLLSHPQVVWYGLGAILILSVVAATLLYANHKHHVDNVSGK